MDDQIINLRTTYAKFVKTFCIYFTENSIAFDLLRLSWTPRNLTGILDLTHYRNLNFTKNKSKFSQTLRDNIFFSPFLVIVVVNLRSCWTEFLLVGFFACLVFCGYSMVLTALGLGL